MTDIEALNLVEELLRSLNIGQPLSDIQSVVFLGTWEGCSYRKIADEFGYELDYIKQVGSRLWRSLSQAAGEEVSKRNIQAVLRRYQQSSPMQDWGEAIAISHFYGRVGELEILET